jgi:hypothetical protein
VIAANISAERRHPDRGATSDTGDMPGFVDPRPHQEAEIRAKRAELAAAADDADRIRLQGELRELEDAMGRGRGGLRRFLLGWGHRSVPW